MHLVENQIESMDSISLSYMAGTQISKNGLYVLVPDIDWMNERALNTNHQLGIMIMSLFALFEDNQYVIRVVWQK